ncbi:hypothetical protein VUR80DRAFT_1401 [Thermomyces stellatus]
MLRGPPTPHQYETVDEPEDEVQAADELALSEPGPQLNKRFATAARGGLAEPPASKTVTPVPVPKTAALSQETSTAQPRSGTSTPGGKSGNKGRPKGWRPGMSYAAVRNFGPEIAAKFARLDSARQPQGATAKLASTESGRRERKKRAAAPEPGTQAIKKTRVRSSRSSPPTSPGTAPIKIYLGLEIKSVPYMCEWKDCKSELHNLSTLEKHVRVVHCRGKRKECLWRKCADARTRFDTDEELDEHLRRAHFIPYAWHYGDGPKISFGTPPISPGLPRYLYDARTRKQVTESIQEQVVEDEKTRKDREQWLRNFKKQEKLIEPYVENSEEEREVRLLGWGPAPR